MSKIVFQLCENIMKDLIKILVSVILFDSQYALAVSVFFFACQIRFARSKHSTKRSIFSRWFKFALRGLGLFGQRPFSQKPTGFQSQYTCLIFFHNKQRVTDFLSVFYCKTPKSVRTLDTRLALVWHHSSTHENSLWVRDGKRLDDSSNKTQEIAKLLPSILMNTLIFLLRFHKYLAGPGADEQEHATLLLLFLSRRYH